MNSKVYVGIGIGSSRVKVVADSGNFRAPSVLLRDHMGSPREVVADMLGTLNPADVAGLAVTGGEGASLIAGRKICECEAVEESLKLLGLRADAILSLGGESFVAYPMDRRGRILDCVSGNRCAAGTVEFFKQQLGRMGLSIEEGTRLAGSGKVVPLAKRCSVHCKSDCTHALNKSRCSVADVAHTLCHNMAEKAAGLLRKNRIDKGDVIVIGGAAVNVLVVDYIRKFLPSCTITVPEHAPYFETVGAAALARSRSLPLPSNWDDIFSQPRSSFDFLPPLGNYSHMVTQHPPRNSVPRKGGRYLLGIDGGSTTTKAALVDPETLEICASVYMRTNGNPERALKECLRAIREQVRLAGADPVTIAGVATTGSSGEILSVLCETQAYHNEIVAHAFGAAHFCPEADTIFEVGGQDAKFTSLRNGVAVDFNMNEACSAGTGSFIEESAREDLGVPMHDIAERALQSTRPPRFSDQCAAFANSDIRKAFQEGATKEDNLAGLVYAIAENYISKVVGERKIGDRILFQGGTSRNVAIACAFAAKTGKHIEVPPNSELIGCYGIALWLRDKMASGVIPPRNYDLDCLLESSATDREEFVCKSCENLCTVQNLTINGRKYPFGGQCSKWENARNRKYVRAEEFDHIAERNRMVFEEFGVAPVDSPPAGGATVIGMQGVFSVYALYPLYSRFFAELGHPIAFSQHADPRGTGMCQSNRCYPYEIAHGTFHDLLQRGVTTVFVPHVVGLPRDEEEVPSLSCPIAQAVPYYVSAAFAEHDVTILDPVLDMSEGIRGAEQAFVALGESLGHGKAESTAAFRAACDMQEACDRALKEKGRLVLARLERENSIGIVVVGRPYNAFSKTANMGVPRKFASRGVAVIPYEYLPFEEEPVEPTMYWKYGQMILKSLRYVRRHPQLFPVYISNFGCGPDSFLQHFAGFVMEGKPMLYLEMDSHTADAGIGTRTTAFLDIISGYRKLGVEKPAPSGFTPAEFVPGRKTGWVRDSSGTLVKMTDPRVSIVFPSMGRFHTEAGASAAPSIGMKAIALPPVDDRVRALGKSFTSGKECSPAVLTVGSLVNYCSQRHAEGNTDELALFFMPTAGGPCRFGQYNVYLRKLVDMLQFRNVAIFSPSAANGYGNLGWRFLRAACLSFMVADLMRDVQAMLRVAAEDADEALGLFDLEWKRLTAAMSSGYGATWKALGETAGRLAGIRLKLDPRTVPKVLLTGEIFVRSDELSRRSIEDHYAEHSLMLKIADNSEWLYYCDWMHLNRLAGPDAFPQDFMSGKVFARHLRRALLERNPDSTAFVATRAKVAYQQSIERRARKILSRSGLLTTKMHDIDSVVRAGSAFVAPALAGEAILNAGTISLALEDPQDNYCGIVLIGPFNCMPTGVAESVVKPYARRMAIPYLTFETDGSPLTPNFRSQMEVHSMRCRAWAEERHVETGDRRAGAQVP